MNKFCLLLFILLFSYSNGNAFSFFYAKKGVYYLCSSDKMKAEVIAYRKNKPKSDLTDSEGQYLFWCEDDFDYTSYINEYNNKYRDHPYPPSTISRSPKSELSDETTIPSSIHAYTIVQSSDKKTVSRKYAGTYKVVGIGDEAFKNRKRPQSLTISDGIEYIGYQAFYKRFGSGIEKLFLPNTLKRIGSDAFCYCDIRTITVPKSLEECGSGVFANCEKLKTADVQCDFVPFAMFWECKNLEEVTLSDKTITIDSDAFYYCENLRSVNPVLKRENGEVYWENVLPSGIKTIYYGAFKECHSLETIELPLYLDSLGHRYTETENGHGWIGRVFEYCKSLKRVTFHKNLKYIGHDSFSNCTALEEVIVDWDEPIEGEKNIFSNIIARDDTTDYIYEHATLVIRNTSHKYREVSPWMYFKTHSHPGGIVHDDTVTLTAKNYTRQYGNTNPTFEYEVTSGTITSGEPTITCSATTTSPVGTYDIVIAKGTVSNNNVELVKGTLTITKAPLTISAGNYTKKEGEDNPTFKATYNGFKNNETEAVLTKKPTITTTATKTSAAGEYPVTVSGAEAQNYAITYQNGTLTITKKSTGDNSLQVGDRFTTNGMKFKVTSISPYEVQVGDNTLTAIDTNTEGAVIIPSTVKDPEGRSYSVTSIGSSAFSQCKKITEISIPEGVTTISDAFFQCTSLTSVNIPSSITRIDVGAFNQCPALAEVHITDLKAWCGIEFANNTTANPLTIAQHLYLNGKEVKNLVIPEGTTKISKYAFYECNTLTSVTIPAGVTDFGESAFDSCEGLTSVTCASSISFRAFWKCTNLTSVTLLKGVEIIGARSFAYCEALTKVNIEDIASWCAIEFNDNPLNYAHHLFVNGQEVKELVIPEGVSEIKGGAFVGCTGLSSVNIPSSVTTIGTYAFRGCTGLSSVNIPSSVTAIGTLAFDGCTGLEEVHSEITEPFSIDRNTFSNETYKKPLYVPYGTKTKYEATNGWKNFKNIVESENSNKFEKDGVTYEILDDETVAITKDNNVQHTQVLPIFVLYDGKSRTVTVIGDGAFKNNQYLTQITIPSTINKIGDGAFAGCVNLAVIIIHVENPIDIAHVRTRAGSSSVFEGVDMETCILYVPDNSVTAYKAADGWKDFKNILPISTLGIQGIGLDGQPFEVYNMQGRKVRHEATSLDGLPKGVYIINGKKVVK